MPDGEGGIDIHVATQWLHVDRDQVAPCLALRPEQVRLHLASAAPSAAARDLSMQIHGALLALHTGRPVKMVYDRAESFTGRVHRHPARIRCEHRATGEGRLTCVRMEILLDGGAYASSSTAVASNAASFALGPYRVDNALIEATAVYSNNPPCGAMRGFGAVQTCFAGEAQMDLRTPAGRWGCAPGAAPARPRQRHRLVELVPGHPLLPVTWVGPAEGVVVPDGPHERRATSSRWQATHNDEPSPWTTMGLPLRRRSRSDSTRDAQGSRAGGASRLRLGRADDRGGKGAAPLGVGEDALAHNLALWRTG